MCEETKCRFAGETTEDTLDVGSRVDTALEQLERLAAAVELQTKATIAAAVIAKLGVTEINDTTWVHMKTDDIFRGLKDFDHEASLAKLEAEAAIYHNPAAGEEATNAK